MKTGRETATVSKAPNRAKDTKLGQADKAPRGELERRKRKREKRKHRRSEKACRVSPVKNHTPRPRYPLGRNSDAENNRLRGLRERSAQPVAGGAACCDLRCDLPVSARKVACAKSVDRWDSINRLQLHCKLQTPPLLAEHSIFLRYVQKNILKTHGFITVIGRAVVFKHA